MVFHLDQQPRRFQVFDDPLARRKTVQPLVPFPRRPAFVVVAQRFRRQVDLRRLVQHRDARQPTPLADGKVVRIVSGRHLDGTRTKFWIRPVVRHHGDFAPGEGQLQHPADDMAIPGISRVDRNRCIPQHRLRPRRRHHNRPASIRQHVADRVQLA